MSKREENLYKRGRIWWVKIELDGRKIHESTCETSVVKARDYRDEAREKLKKLRKGQREDVTYDIAMDKFLTYCESTLKASSVKKYEMSARAMHHHFTGRNLADIKKGEIREYLDSRVREVSGSAVNRDRALLSSMFTFAADRDWVEFNPVLTVKRQRENEARTRNFSHDEFRAIHAECGKLLGDMAEFNTLTGLRPSEMVFLKHSDIDLDHHQLIINSFTAKSRKSRIVPLDVKAVQIYKSQIRHINSPYVFWHDDGLPYKHAPRAFVTAAKEASRKAMEKAKLPEAKEAALKLADAEMHDLRRTFTCWRARKKTGKDRKVELETLSKILGHSSYAVTEKHYWFLLREDLHEAIRGVTNSSQAQETSGVNLSLINAERKAK